MIAGLNKDGQDWSAVKRYVTAAVETSMAELASHGTTPERTEFLRGRVDAYRGLIADAEPIEIPQSEPINYEA